MKLRVVALLALAAVSCRTGRPTGSPVAALSAISADDARAKLDQLRESFPGMRSLMHVRATVNGKTQSFRAQLIVHDARRMELIAYTPVGTTALKMKAEGDQITTDPPVAPDAFAFLRDAGLTPAETGMLLLGIPPTGGDGYEFAATGLASASPGRMKVVFEPPAFPAKRVVITRGDDRIEIVHDEVVRED
jgi:hypothetical protein